MRNFQFFPTYSRDPDFLIRKNKWCVGTNFPDSQRESGILDSALRNRDNFQKRVAGFTRYTNFSCRPWRHDHTDGRSCITGFTLIEIVVSIAILIIIAAAASVSFSNSRNIRELTTASQNVLSILRTAQSKTLAGEEASQWGVHIEQTQVVLFRGATYAGAGFTEAYPLPATIEIANSSLAGSGSDIIFKRIEGTTDETGTFELRVKSDTTKTFSVTVEGSGKVYQTGTAPTPTGTRLQDARHRAFTLGWSMQDSATTTLTFENPPYPNTISAVPMASYFDAGRTKFDWSGAVAVGTTTQILRIHTTFLSATNAVLHIDRDCRKNTKKMRIDIGANYIASYEADCKTVTVGNFGGTMTEP